MGLFDKIKNNVDKMKQNRATAKEDKALQKLFEEWKKFEHDTSKYLDMSELIMVYGLSEKDKCQFGFNDSSNSYDFVYGNDILRFRFNIKDGNKFCIDEGKCQTVIHNNIISEVGGLYNINSTYYKTVEEGLEIYKEKLRKFIQDNEIV